MNDTYGHAVGDVVIKETAHIIGKSIRTVDTACRWGGGRIRRINTDDCKSFRHTACTKNLESGF
ncbi:MAG TPA: diguanylate cyclase [Nitrospirota bacterium]|nr:diguanylate cyclase [Nitrospirota bacterium]